MEYRVPPQSGRGRGAPRLSRSQAQLHHEYYAGKRSLYQASHAKEAWQELYASSPYFAYPAHRSPPTRLHVSRSEAMIKKQNARPLTAPVVYHDGGRVFLPGALPLGSPRGLTATKNVRAHPAEPGHTTCCHSHKPARRCTVPRCAVAHLPPVDCATAHVSRPQVEKELELTGDLVRSMRNEVKLAHEQLALERLEVQVRAAAHKKPRNPDDTLKYSAALLPRRRGPMLATPDEMCPRGMRSHRRS